MAIQYINTGSYPNAGNGDSIRTAFTKVNENFSEISNLIDGNFNDNGVPYKNIENGTIGSLAYYSSSTNIKSTSKLYYSSEGLTIGNNESFSHSLTILSGDNVEDIQTMYQFYNLNEVTPLKFLRSRGTYNAPLSLIKDDEIGKISFNGFNGMTFPRVYQIRCIVESNPVGYVVPSRLVFTSNDGTKFVDVFEISSTGTVSLSNLKSITTSSISIESNLIPTDNTFSLGTSTSVWNELYVNTSTQTTVKFSNNTTQTTAYQFIDTVPTTSNDPGVKGQLAISGSDLYLCVNDNNWIKFTGTTF